MPLLCCSFEREYRQLRVWEFIKGKTEIPQKSWTPKIAGEWIKLNFKQYSVGGKEGFIHLFTSQGLVYESLSLRGEQSQNKGLIITGSAKVGTSPSTSIARLGQCLQMAMYIQFANKVTYHVQHATLFWTERPAVTCVEITISRCRFLGQCFAGKHSRPPCIQDHLGFTKRNLFFFVIFSILSCRNCYT